MTGNAKALRVNPDSSWNAGKGFGFVEAYKIDQSNIFIRIQSLAQQRRAYLAEAQFMNHPDERYCPPSGVENQRNPYRHGQKMSETGYICYCDIQSVCKHISDTDIKRGPQERTDGIISKKGGYRDALHAREGRSHTIQSRNEFGNQKRARTPTFEHPSRSLCGVSGVAAKTAEQPKDPAAPPPPGLKPNEIASQTTENTHEDDEIYPELTVANESSRHHKESNRGHRQAELTREDHQP
nr:hypothetical protein [Granulicella sp. L60]